VDAAQWVLVSVAAVVLLSTIFRRLRRKTPESPEDVTQTVRELAARLMEKHLWVDPDLIESDRRFKRGIALLAAPEVSVDVPLALANEENDWTACMALLALEERDDVPDSLTDKLLIRIRSASYAREAYILRVLTRHATRPVIGRVLAIIDQDLTYALVAKFVGVRRDKGEHFDVEVLRKEVPVRLAEPIEEMLDRYEPDLGEGFREAYDAWLEQTVDLEFLNGIGKVWQRPFDDPPAVLVGRRDEIVELAAEQLADPSGRSVLLVGVHGVGKTALARAALDRLPPSVVVFDATAAQVNAGAIYIGELEARVKALAEKLRGHSVVWHLPNLEEAHYAGQHTRSPHGMLDAMLPHIESGALRLVAEVTPQTLESLLAERPRLATAFQALEVRPLGEREAMAVARETVGQLDVAVHVSEQTLRSGFELANQFLPRAAPPGNLLRLVRAAVEDVAERQGHEVEHTDLVAALAASTGLPLAILDATRPISLDEVRSFFRERVIGQEEPVELIVERIALVKAGVTDPTRPLGVFLFVGPTGTGKTEIAKTLAEFLFGSPDRLVRLDMSEFQTPESFDRLLTDTSIDIHGAPLIAAVRKDPFSVILLDEFEKAAAPVWDVFLQVFDDGRLTDTHGRVLDLRRCVIILTSNVGSSIATSPGLGFLPDETGFRQQDLERAVKRSFRPEFLNRLDRIVVFQPFDRAQMRALLEKELSDALSRRGLRERPWAVEVDDSAYEFLIDEGFSPEFGARPLKRAIERHLLTPLAAAIVEHRAPAGDQFLFVTAPGGRRIEVRFVDPDAEEPEGVDREEPVAEALQLDVRALAYAPYADSRATRFLLDEIHRVATAVRSDGVRERKEEGLRAMREASFWDDTRRFATLAEVEYLDRLEAALATVEKLGERLKRARPTGGSPNLTGIVAGRLYVLDSALAGLAEGAPLDVFLRARIAGERSGGTLLELLARMYLDWAEHRGMRVKVLGRSDSELLLAVSGLGCGRILEAEAGLHVLESVGPKTNGAETDRLSAIVEVAPWVPGPPERSPSEAARAAFDGAAAPSSIVRQYRLEPDPLVRDRVRGYRTGRADRVLAGDFDLL
jgi:ATP-dependent Clp protease ATP-binding subunit ClpC